MKPPLRRKAPGHYHHGDLRATLIRAAARMAAKDGVDAINLSELARRVGVSSATLFRHFTDRTALLVAVGEAGIELLRARSIAAAAAETDPVEQARARGIAYVRFAVEEPGYFRVMHHHEVVARSPLIASLSSQSRAAMDAVLGVFQIGEASAELTQRTAGTLAAQALTYGLARMILDGLLGPVSPEQAVVLAHELTGVLGEGLAGR